MTSIVINYFNDKESQFHIRDNHLFFRERLGASEEKEKYRNAFENILEAVVITVTDVSEAFQLFDSQNSRGKSLDPHDLLKSYHLRAMNEYSFEFEKHELIKRREAVEPKVIRELYDKYLYRILN